MIDRRLLNGKTKVTAIMTFDRQVKMIRRTEVPQESRLINHYAVVREDNVNNGIIKMERPRDVGYKIEVLEFPNIEEFKKYSEKKGYEVSIDHLHGDFNGGEPVRREPPEEWRVERKRRWF